MKPDFGLYHLQAGLRRSVAHSFYDIPIDHLSRISQDSVSTMVNIVHSDVEYAISFDLTGNTIFQLLAIVPSDLKNSILTWLADSTTLYKTIEFPSPIIIKTLSATLGIVQTGQNGEKFVPFIVQTVA
jgi:hypothetical protein